MADIVVNTDSLDQLLRTFGTEHQNIQVSTGTLRRDLDGAEWYSPRADEFRAAWRDRYEPALRDLTTALETYQRDIRDQLDRYRANEGQA